MTPQTELDYQGKPRNPTGCLGVLILMAFLFFAGCDNGPLDKQIVTDSKGNIYMLENRVGSLYFLHQIDTTQVKIKHK